jgi:phosphoserine phosphatase RsbU/P
VKRDERWPWREAVVDLLERTRLAPPDELPGLVNAAVAPLGLEVTIYLVDHEQRTLHAVPEPGRPAPAHTALPVGGSLAGRAFMGTEPVAAAAPDGSHRLWMPLLDGSERLGVLAVDTVADAADTAEFRAQCRMFCALIGHLLAIKMAYGDALARVRRTRMMSVASELLWRLVPPLTFASDRFVVSAVLEPCYEAGGDGFDYAVDGSTAYLGVVDTAGHGLSAGVGTAVALSAARAARRGGHDLSATARAIDAAFGEHFPELRLATGVLATLDLDSGVLRYVNAGHPPPLILRGGKVVRRLRGGRRLPFGLDNPRVELGEEVLQPGDRLLCYTDGVTEARDSTGEMFGEHRLVDLTERHASAGLPAPETLRRLSHAVLAHLDGPPADDATLLLVEWSRAAGRRLMP